MRTLIALGLIALILLAGCIGQKETTPAKNETQKTTFESFPEVSTTPDADLTPETDEFGSVI